MEPLQSTFSVAAILGEKVIRKKGLHEENLKRPEDGNNRLELPPTPQPSDSEEDELPRKRRCLEQCELAKVSLQYLSTKPTFNSPEEQILLHFNFSFSHVRNHANKVFMTTLKSVPENIYPSSILLRGRLNYSIKVIKTPKN